MPLLCGIDVGTTGLKLGIFNAEGQPQGICPVEYAFRSPREGFAEMEGEVYWQALKTGLLECCRQGRCEPSQIEAIGISSTGQAFLFVDEAGRELTPMIVWLDRRGDEFVPELYRRFRIRSYYLKTGIPQFVGLTTLPKLMWFKHYQPELLERAARIVLIDAYVIGRLTGRWVGSDNIADSAGMWNPLKGRWLPEMLKLLGVKGNRFNDIRCPGEVGANVSARAAAETGLREGVPVVVGANDQIAGMLGSGNVEPGILTDTTGTALGAFATATEAPKPHSKGPWPAWSLSTIPGLYNVASFCNTSGILLKWLRESIGFSETYDEMARLAATSPPGSSGITVCPHYEGTMFPDPLPNSSGIIAGLRLRHRKADLLRAFFEAVAFCLRENVEFLSAYSTANRIRSMGGAAKSAFWLQMKADVIGLPVEKPQCQEASILGDALLAGKAIGLYPSLAEAAKNIVKIERVFEPNPALKPAYDEAYARYRELVRRNFQPASAKTRSGYS